MRSVRAQLPGFTFAQEEREELGCLAVSHGIEERSLADAVHHVHLGPRRQAGGQDGRAAGAGQQPGTAGLVEDRDLQHHRESFIVSPGLPATSLSGILRLKWKLASHSSPSNCRTLSTSCSSTAAWTGNFLEVKILDISSRTCEVKSVLRTEQKLALMNVLEKKAAKEGQE